MSTVFLKRIIQTQKLWDEHSKFGKSIHAFALDLLKQYTRFWFLYGHWNLHHVKDVNEILKAQKNPANQLQITSLISDQIHILKHPKGRLAASLHVVAIHLPDEAVYDNFKKSYIVTLTTTESYALLKRYSAPWIVRLFRGDGLWNDHVRLVRDAIKNFPLGPYQSVNTLLKAVNDKLMEKNVQLSDDSRLKQLMGSIKKLAPKQLPQVMQEEQDFRGHDNNNNAPQVKNKNPIKKILKRKIEIECDELTKNLDNQLAIIHSFLFMAKGLKLGLEKLTDTKSNCRKELTRISDLSTPKKQITALNALEKKVGLLMTQLSKHKELNTHIAHEMKSVQAIQSKHCNPIDKAYFGGDNEVSIIQKLNSHTAALKKLQTKIYGGAKTPYPKELAEYYQIDNVDNQKGAFDKVRGIYIAAMIKGLERNKHEPKRLEIIAGKFFDAALASDDDLSLETLSRLADEYNKSKSAYKYMQKDFNKLLADKQNVDNNEKAQQPKNGSIEL